MSEAVRQTTESCTRAHIAAGGHMVGASAVQVLLDEIDRLRDLVVDAADENRVIEYLRYCDVSGDVIQAIEEGVHLRDPATWGEESE